MQRINKCYYALISMLSYLPVTTVHADVKTWTGNDVTNPTYWGEGDNWTPSGAGFGDYAYFPSGSTVKTVQMVQAGGNSFTRSGVQGINFEDAGWLITDTVGDGTGAISYAFNGSPASVGSQPYGINSSGAGINEIAAGFSLSTTNNPGAGQPQRPFTVNTGNTLLFSGNFINGQNWTLQGNGTMVVNNTNSNRTNTFNAGLVINDSPTLLSRGTVQIAIGGQDFELDSGTIGGDGRFSGRTQADVTFTGTKLAPGGNGTAVGGDEIGTLTWISGLDTNYTNLSLANGTTFEVDIGDGGVGDNDQLILDLKATAANNGFLDIENGTTLNIVGSVIQIGTYIIVDDAGTSSDIQGTFTDVLLNGSPINPSDIVVNYGPDQITVDVLKFIPEPSTYTAVFGLLAVLMVSRRQRRA